MKGIIVVAIVLLGVVGCVSAPTVEQQRDAYYGPYPEDFQDIIKNYMASRLKDPTSATYNFNAIPMKQWFGGGLTPVSYGYGICVLINAKNSFGGYVGPKKYFFLIQDNQVIRAEDMPLITEKVCPGSW